MKSNAYCIEFESNKVNFRMCLVHRKIRQWTRKVQKNNNKKKMWKADMEVAALNRQKTVVRVG